MALRKKAMDKNPDEFHFKMIHSQLKVCPLLVLLLYSTNINCIENTPTLVFFVAMRFCDLCSFCYCSGWSSHAQTKRGNNDRGAEESDEDPGHQICGNEASVGDEGRSGSSYLSVYLCFYPFKDKNNGLNVSVFQKIERMKSELHLLDADEEKKNKHVFYVDSKQEGNLV